MGLSVLQVHRVTSMGFCVVQRKQKLRTEHTLGEDGLPLPKAELGKKVKQLKATLAPELLFEVGTTASISSFFSELASD